jgi:hypothetical protein
VILIAVILAILKPWSEPTPEGAAIASTPPTPSAEPSSDAIANYNPDVFGVYEPAPDWELWPAGYLVSFGFAMRVEGGMESPPPAAAQPGPSASPTARSSARPTPVPRGADEPRWPSTITITASSHLALVGINTPLGYRVAATLVRLEPDGTTTPYGVLRLPSPWPTHFTVIAMDDGSATTPRESWPTGRYRLHLRIDPGPIVRDIEIVIGDREAPATPGTIAPAASGAR